MNIISEIHILRTVTISGIYCLLSSVNFAQEGEPFTSWNLFDNIVDTNNGSGSYDLRFDYDDFGSPFSSSGWVTGNNSDLTKWEEDIIIGPDGSNTSVAKFTGSGFSSNLARGLMQITEEESAWEYIGLHTLQFDLLLNKPVGPIQDVLRVEVIGFKIFEAWPSGYFALSGSGSGGGSVGPDISGGDTVSPLIYDTLLSTLDFNVTNDATVSASTWQQIELTLDFGPGIDPEIVPDLGSYDRIAIRFTGKAGSNYLIAIDNVAITSAGAPTDITLSNMTLDENEASGTTIGTLSANDPDIGDTFTYSLTPGSGDTDNNLFSISGDQLLSASIFDHETQNPASIRVEVEDSEGETFEKALTITIQDVPEAPTDIALSSTELLAGLPIGTIVGEFSRTDPDVGDTYNYTLVSGEGDTDNGLFIISVSGVTYSLKTAVEFDFDTQQSSSIRIRITDSATQTLEEAFTITTLEDISTPPQAQIDTAIANAGLTGADAANDAIPHHDGVENLLKYAFNMNLTNSDSSIMQPDGNSGVPSGDLVEVDGQTFWRVQYVRRKGSGLNYTPQKTDSLTQEFIPLEGGVSVENIDANWARYTVDEPCDPETVSQCFSRVQVELP